MDDENDIATQQLRYGTFTHNAKQPVTETERKYKPCKNTFRIQNQVDRYT